MKKNPVKPKKKEETSAFADLLKQVEKEKKRAKVVYSVGIVILVLSLLMFLLFSPFKIPVFSQLGDRILGREEIVEEEVEEEEEIEEMEEVEEEEVEEEVVTAPKPKTTTTPTPTPAPAPQVTYNCTDSEIAELRAGIEELKRFKKETEQRINEHFFACFDVVTATHPYETEKFYQDECWYYVCVDYAPDLCAMPDEFQKGINDFQNDLNHCLSDR